MEEELLEEDMILLYKDYLKWEKAKRESIERINNLINKIREKNKMGKIKEFYNQQFEEFNMNDDYDDYDYFKRKNEQAKSVLEFIFNTEEDEWEAAENYKMEQQYVKIISDVYNNKKCN